MNGERLIGSANAFGTAQRALDDLLGYVAERKQFGRPIGTFQALAHRIADLAIEVECSRLITYGVAARVDDHRGSDQELGRLTSMAKVRSPRLPRRWPWRACR